MQATEGQSKSRDGIGARCFETFQQASVAQQLQDLPAETTSLRGDSGLRLPLEYQGSHSGQSQFNGEHQSGRAGAHDDDVSLRHWLPPSTTFRVTGVDVRCIGQFHDDSSGWSSRRPALLGVVTWHVLRLGARAVRVKPRSWFEAIPDGDVR